MSVGARRGGGAFLNTICDGGGIGSCISKRAGCICVDWAGGCGGSGHGGRIVASVVAAGFVCTDWGGDHGGGGGHSGGCRCGRGGCYCGGFEVFDCTSTVWGGG